MKKIISILTCTSLLLVLFLSSSIATENGTVNESPEFLENQDTAITVYNDLLSAFATLYSSERLGDQYPDYYAGAYVDRETGHLTVLTCGATENDLNYLTDLCKDTDTRFETAEFSYNYLLSLQREIEASLETAAKLRTPSNITRVGIRDDQNKVFVGVSESSTQPLAAINEGLTEDLVVNSTFTSNNDRSSPFALYVAPDAEECATLTPGTKIDGYMEGSIGFYGSINYGGTTRYGFFTAQHVMKGQSYAYLSLFDKAGAVLATANTNETDVAFVEMTGYGHSFSNKVDNIQITSGVFNIPPVGTTIYKVGCKTGTTVGTVLEVAGSGYLENRTVYFSNSMVTTINCIKGDSGGLVYTKSNGVRVVGLVRGGAPNANDCVVAKAAFFPSHWQSTVH